MNTHDLANAADENLAYHAGWIHQQTDGMFFISDDGIAIVDSGMPCDTFNLICWARLHAEDADRRIYRAIEHFSVVQRPFSWWLGPGATPHDLDARLIAAGLEQAETEVAMYADLERIRPFDVLLEGLRIERVRTAAQLEDFARTIGMQDHGPDPHVLRFYERAAPVVLAVGAPMWFYVGYIGATPVASAELTVGGGVVGLYNISTLAAYRRRGIGTAMTLRPLLDAREQGHRTAILQASADGVWVYAKLGFASFGTISEFKPHRSVL